MSVYKCDCDQDGRYKENKRNIYKKGSGTMHVTDADRHGFCIYCGYAAVAYTQKRIFDTNHELVFNSITSEAESIRNTLYMGGRLERDL